MAIDVSQILELGIGQVDRITLNSALSPYTDIAVSDTLYLLDADGPIVFNLPAVPTTNTRRYFKDLGDADPINSVTINGNGKTIDALSSIVIDVAYQSIALEYNGTEWLIINF